MKTRPETSTTDGAGALCSIPSECGRSYIGETGRPPVYWVPKHRRNVKKGILEKSKLAGHAYERGHRIMLDIATILGIGSNRKNRKYGVLNEPHQRQYELRRF
jgi:hypothetical protein